VRNGHSGGSQPSFRGVHLGSGHIGPTRSSVDSDANDGFCPLPRTAVYDEPVITIEGDDRFVK